MKPETCSHRSRTHVLSPICVHSAQKERGDVSTPTTLSSLALVPADIPVEVGVGREESEARGKCCATDRLGGTRRPGPALLRNEPASATSGW